MAVGQYGVQCNNGVNGVLAGDHVSFDKGPKGVATLSPRSW